MSKINNIFHVLLLEQNTIRKKQVNKLSELKLESELNARKDKKYKFKSMKDYAVYTEVAESQLPELYYLISCNGYLNNKNSLKPAPAIIHI